MNLDCSEGWVRHLRDARLYRPTDALLPRLEVGVVERRFAVTGLSRETYAKAQPMRDVVKGAFARVSLPSFTSNSFRKTSGLLSTAANQTGWRRLQGLPTSVEQPWDQHCAGMGRTVASQSKNRPARGIGYERRSIRTHDTGTVHRDGTAPTVLNGRTRSHSSTIYVSCLECLSRAANLALTTSSNAPSYMRSGVCGRPDSSTSIGATASYWKASRPQRG